MPDPVAEAERALINHLAPGLTVPEGAAETLGLARRYAALRALAELSRNLAECSAPFGSSPLQPHHCVHYGGERECIVGRREALEKEATG